MKNIINKELELLKLIRLDMIIRGDKDKNGITVVNMSGSIWNELNERILQIESN